MATHSVPPDLKERLKASYDAITPEYNTWTAQHFSLRLDFLDKLLAHVPPTATAVLELGAGAGVPATKHLVESLPAAHVTANDLSAAQVALGRTNLAAVADRVTWVEGDMNALEFADASFDAVVALYSVIHLPREEQREMIAKIHRWLRPGGAVLFNFSAEEMEGFVMEKWLHEKGWMYWSGFGAEESLRQVKEAGLEIVEGEVKSDEVDASFLWVLARKGT